MKTQHTVTDVKGMTAQQIVEALAAGNLQELLTGKPVHNLPATGQLSAEDLKHMTPQQIDAARLGGRLDDLLGRTG